MTGAPWTRRVWPGLWPAGLLVAGTAAMLVEDWRLLLGGLAATLLLYAAARIPPKALLAQMRPVLALLALVFAAQLLLAGWQVGAVVVLRLALMILLAGFVSLAVPAAAMTQAIERALRPLSRIGLRPARLALALALAIRFLPLLAALAAQVREAQRARGRERNPIALVVPTIVQSLRMADDLAAAIEARGFDPES